MKVLIPISGKQSIQYEILTILQAAIEVVANEKLCSSLAILSYHRLFKSFIQGVCVRLYNGYPDIVEF